MWTVILYLQLILGIFMFSTRQLTKIRHVLVFFYTLCSSRMNVFDYVGYNIFIQNGTGFYFNPTLDWVYSVNTIILTYFIML